MMRNENKLVRLFFFLISTTRIEYPLLVPIFFHAFFAPVGFSRREETHLQAISINERDIFLLLSLAFFFFFFFFTCSTCFQLLFSSRKI